MKNKGRIEIIIGLLLIVTALSLTSYNYYLTMSADRSSKTVLDGLKSQLIEDGTISGSGSDSFSEGGTQREVLDIPDYILNPQMPMPKKKIDGIDYVATLNMPTIERELPILWEYVYNNLRIAPCRYEGSVYTGNLVICGHNYMSHFGKLEDLSVGDKMTLTDMDGNLFTYEVKEIIVLAPTEVDEFIDNGYALTLFTCTYTGAKRVIVRCDLIKSDDWIG